MLSGKNERAARNLKCMGRPRPPKAPKPGDPKYNTKEFKRLSGYSEATLYRLIDNKHVREQPFRGRWSEEQLQDVRAYRAAVEAGRPTGPARINQTFPLRPPVLKALSVIRDKGDYPNRGAVIEHCILHASACEGFEPGVNNLAVNEDGAAEEVDLSGL